MLRGLWTCWLLVAGDRVGFIPLTLAVVAVEAEVGFFTPHQFTYLRDRRPLP